MSIKKQKPLIILAVLVFMISFSTACSPQDQTSSEYVEASGNISVIEIDIAPQAGGEVEQVNFSEGDDVQQGDLLFSINDDIILAQIEVAKTAVLMAEENLLLLETKAEGIQIQYDIALQAARAQGAESRITAWANVQLEEIDTPVWYFSSSEWIEAAQLEVESAREAYETQQENLQQVLEDASNEDFLQIEEELAQNQFSLINAQYTLEQANNAENNTELADAAQEIYDAALAALNASQQEYNRMLDTNSAQNVLEARAKTAVTKARYENAMDQYNSYLTGEDSLQLQAIDNQLAQAEQGYTQAQTALEQARKNLELLQIQADMYNISAPTDGIIINQNIEIGEILSPGGIVMTIANLENVQLLVYIAENEYGKVKIGQEAIIEVDSWPEKEFIGTVTYIADEAVYTPSNVQTKENRTSTVYEIKISIPNPDLDLKPGMPADVKIMFE